MRVLCRQHPGETAYEGCLAAMQSFTATRTAATEDEIWLVQHPPVFTLGRAARRCHVLAPGTIPVVPSDRGGQVTYHGPGQLVAYVLLDVRRMGLGPRELVRRLEQGTIAYLRALGIVAERRVGAPGVYVDGAKIAALGLRIRNGMCYHGIALNVSTDLEAFDRIDPCGYAGLRVTRLCDLGGPDDCRRVAVPWVGRIVDALYGPGAAELEWRDTRRLAGVA